MSCHASAILCWGAVAVTTKLNTVVKEDGAIAATNNKLNKVVKEDGAIAATTNNNKLKKVMN
jgi:hypothetical protein